MTQKDGNYKPFIHEPPCTTCERLFDFNPCTFAKSGKPPEGAEFTDRDVKLNSHVFHGYDIFSCPEYEPERKRSGWELDTDGCEKLLAAVTKKAFSDYAGCYRQIKNTEHQAAIWSAREIRLRSEMKQIENFVGEHGEAVLRRIRKVISVTENGNTKPSRSLDEDGLKEAVSRAERAENLNKLAEARCTELKKFNTALLWVLRNGKTLCDICVECNTPQNMGCRQKCRDCEDKCICGKCVRYSKFEFGGGK